MDTFFSVLVIIGLCYGAYRAVVWMLKAGRVQASKVPPLSPTDLKVLEESAERLMDDLRTLTDECVARIEKACEEAERRLQAARNDEICSQSFGEPSSVCLSKGEEKLLEGLKSIGKK